MDNKKYLSKTDIRKYFCCGWPLAVSIFNKAKDIENSKGKSIFVNRVARWAIDYLVSNK